MTALVALSFISSNSSAQSTLVGSEITIEIILQNTPASTPTALGVETTVDVAEPVIEFPSLQALQVPGAELVDVAINVGADFLEIDFDNVTDPQYGDAFYNGYIFTLDDDVAFNFIAATIDAQTTISELDGDDVVLSGNQLFINVEGLPIDQQDLIRINLQTSAALIELNTISSLGNPTSAKIQGGISVDGGNSYTADATLNVADNILIDFVIEPASQHVGQAAGIVVAVQDLGTGETTLLGSDGLFYAVDLNNPVTFDQITLQAGNLIQVVTGNGLTVTANYLGLDGAIFIGYLLGGVIYYNEEPILLSVE